MGNATSGEEATSPSSSVLTSIVSYVAFVGACIKRKSDEISHDIMDQQTNESIRSINHYKRRSAFVAIPPTEADYNSTSHLRIKSPPLSARSRQNIADREDHLLLSARSIAIQKKAPLFRDTVLDGEGEQPPQPPLSARKMDISSINEMIERDRIRRSIAF